MKYKLADNIYAGREFFGTAGTAAGDWWEPMKYKDLYKGGYVTFTSTAPNYTVGSLAMALYDGYSPWGSLAQSLANQFGGGKEIPPYENAPQQVKDFWMKIARMIIKHSEHYKEAEDGKE